MIVLATQGEALAELQSYTITAETSGATTGTFSGGRAGQKKAEVGAAVPFGRMGTAQDLVGMAIFLATKDADYIVAQCFGVDGGNWMA